MWKFHIKPQNVSSSWTNWKAWPHLASCSAIGCPFSSQLPPQQWGWTHSHSHEWGDAISHYVCAVVFLIVRTKTNIFLIRKGKIREQVICLRQQRAQHIYLWKSGHFYTFKGQGLNLLHLFSWPAWTPWQLALPTLESLQYLPVCGSRVRLSPCGHFSLQLRREAGPLEQAWSIVLGLGLWGKKQFFPVHKSSELASLPALFFLWEGFLALPILATWMALWFHVCCSESGHTLQMWSEQLKTAGQTSPTIQMPYLCSCYFYWHYLFFFFYQSCHMLAHTELVGHQDLQTVLRERFSREFYLNWKSDTEGWMFLEVS